MQIAVISDTHLIPTAPLIDANLRAARHWIAAQDIAHTINLGDVCADGVGRPGQFDHARTQLADWPGQLHIVPGNHDIGDNPGAGPETDQTRLNLYRATFGSDWWQFAIDRWTLIGLDAQLLGRGSIDEEAQAAWLIAALADVGGPIGLFLHKPLFRDGPADRSTHHRYVPPDAGAALLAMFAGHDLRFVASGHTHQSRSFHSSGIEHVWVPSTAFVLPDAMQETIGVKEVAITVLTLDEWGHRFARIQPRGMLRHDLTDHGYIYPEHAERLTAMAAARAT
jgi:3',5'-cyclic AMP phosphodiesterase CpdA